MFVFVKVRKCYYKYFWLNRNILNVEHSSGKYRSPLVIIEYIDVIAVFLIYIISSKSTSSNVL